MWNLFKACWCQTMQRRHLKLITKAVLQPLSTTTFPPCKQSQQPNPFSLQHHHFHARKDDISIPLFSHPSERSLNASFTRSSDAAERASFSFGRPRKTEMAPVTKSGGEKPAEQRSSHAEVKRSRPSLATACFFLKRRGSLD